MNEKKYRPNVVALVLSSEYPHECKFLLAQRIDLQDVWQFPQGGIDEGETPKQALLRELEEEIGTNDVDIVGQFPDWLSYDFPKKLPHMRGYDGQRQRYFLVRLRDDSLVNINTKKPEFKNVRFVSLDEFGKIVTSFKKHLYVKVIRYFQKNGYI